MSNGIVLGLICVDGEAYAQYPSDKQKLSETIVQKVLPKLEKSNHKRTLTQKDFDFHYKCIVRDGEVRVFFCVANANWPKRICWAFIDAVEQDYANLRNPSPKQAKNLLKQKVDFYNDTSNDKIMRLQSKIDDVKDVMIDNIDKILDRGEKLSDLVAATDEMQDTANDFRKKARKVKQSMCLRHFQLILLLIFIILAIIVLIVFIACGFPTFSTCIGSPSS